MANDIATMTFHSVVTNSTNFIKFEVLRMCSEITNNLLMCMDGEFA